MTGLRGDDDPIELVQLGYLEHMRNAADLGPGCAEHWGIRCESEIRDRLTFVHDDLLSRRPGDVPDRRRWPDSTFRDCRADAEPGYNVSSTIPEAGCASDQVRGSLAPSLSPGSSLPPAHFRSLFHRMDQCSCDSREADLARSKVASRRGTVGP